MHLGARDLDEQRIPAMWRRATGDDVVGDDTLWRPFLRWKGQTICLKAPTKKKYLLESVCWHPTALTCYILVLDMVQIPMAKHLGKHVSDWLAALQSCLTLKMKS